MELKSVNQGGNINVAGKKIILGRGPQLQIKDKRVSRKHAILRKKSDGHLYLTPLQHNRCYVRRRGEKKRGLVVKEERRLKACEEFGLLPYNFYFSLIRKPKARSKQGSNRPRSRPRSKSRSEPALMMTSSDGSLKSILKKTPSNYELNRKQRRVLRSGRTYGVKRVRICEEANVLTTQRSLDSILRHKLRKGSDFLRFRLSGNSVNQSESTLNKRPSKQRLLKRLRGKRQAMLRRRRGDSPDSDMSDYEEDDDVTYMVAKRKRRAVKKLTKRKSIQRISKKRKTLNSSQRRKTLSRSRR